MSEVGVGKANLLIVDDIPENIALLAEILKPEYSIRATTKGCQTLSIARMDPPPDLILLDVIMPDMNGFEVCKALKSSNDTHHIPVIFITTMSSPRNEDKGFQLGAVDYIVKPFNPYIVRTRIAAQLASSLRINRMGALVQSRKIKIESLRRSIMDKLKEHTNSFVHPAGGLSVTLTDEERIYLSLVLGSTVSEDLPYKSTILLVAGDPSHLDFLSAVLAEDYEIKTVSQGKHALQIARRFPRPNMILLDITMPDMDGFELCRQLKTLAQTKHIPIIFVTSKTEDSDQLKGFELGAVDYINKPFYPRVIHNRIAAQLSLSLKYNAMNSEARSLADEIEILENTLTQNSNGHKYDQIKSAEMKVVLTDAELRFLSDIFRSD